MSFSKPWGSARLTVFLAFALVALAPRAAEVTLQVISKPFAPTASAGGDSSGVELSADGRFALFVSDGNGLVTNDNNGLNLDLFLRDLQTGQTTLISRTANGESSNGDSYFGFISTNAQYVVFESTSDDLADGDANEGADIFLYERATGTVSLLSQTEDFGGSGEASLLDMTDDARFILFESDADDYNATDLNDGPDLFRLDRQNGQVTLLTKNFDATRSADYGLNATPLLGEAEASMSDNGKIVAYTSTATNLIRSLRSNLNGRQLYLWDEAAGTNRLITPTTNTTDRTTSRNPVVSANGEYVAFLSEGHPASSPNITTRLYLYRVNTGTLTRVAEPLPSTPAAFEAPAFSANGQALVYAFDSQVWLYDVATGTNRLISGTASQVRGSGPSGTPQISRDGNVIVFESFATNLTADATLDVQQLFGFDLQSGALKLLSRSTNGAANDSTLFPVLSADGSRAAFMSLASNLTGEDDARRNDVFVVPTSGTGTVMLVSAGDPSMLSETANADSSLVSNSLSADGRFLVFTSQASDLVRDDENDARDLFLYDRIKNQLTRVPRTFASDPKYGSFDLVGISASGRTVLFNTYERIEASTNYVTLAYDTASSTVKPASVLPDGTVASADATQSSSISSDGRYYAFIFNASVYVRDLWKGTTELLFRPSFSRPGALISPNGRYVAIYQNVGAGGTGTLSSIYDRKTGENRLNPILSLTIAPTAFSSDGSKFVASRSSAQPQLLLINTADFSTNLLTTNYGGFATLSTDAKLVVYSVRRPGTNIVETMIYDAATSNSVPLLFETNPINPRSAPVISSDNRFIALVATNQTGIAQPQFSDVFLYDRVLTNFTLISRGLDGGQAEAPASSPAISADGRYVAFDSVASNLALNDRNSANDIFLARIAGTDANNNGLEDGWELLNLGSQGDPALDPDADGVSNLDEFRAGTDPKNAQSRFALQPSATIEANQLTLSTPVTAGRSYQLQHRASFGTGDWSDVGEPQTAFMSGSLDFTAPAGGDTGFYRIKLID